MPYGCQCSVQQKRLRYAGLHERIKILNFLHYALMEQDPLLSKFHVQKAKAQVDAMPVV